MGTRQNCRRWRILEVTARTAHNCDGWLRLLCEHRQGGAEKGGQRAGAAGGSRPSGGGAMSRERHPHTDIPRNLSFIASLTERAYYLSQRPSLEEEPEEEPGEEPGEASRKY